MTTLCRLLLVTLARIRYVYPWDLLGHSVLLHCAASLDNLEGPPFPILQPCFPSGALFFARYW